MIVNFESELVLWDARRDDTWTFVSLPPDASIEIRELSDGPRRGFGSVRVQATVGSTTWKTSIFPASADRYVLPVKRAVRKAEDLETGDIVTVTVEVLDL